MAFKPAGALPAPEKKPKKAKPGTSLVDLSSLYAKRADEAAADAPVSEGLPRIIAKDGVFWIGETDLPDPLELIVVAESRLNSYYEDSYDPDSSSPPACFSVALAGKESDGMRAHPSSPHIQGAGDDHSCTGCPKNAFGSADVGKGKACQNARTLFVVKADDPALTGDGEPKIASLKLSPTALTPWGKYVKALSTIVKRPPEGVVTAFTFDRKNPVEGRRKAVVPQGYDLITDPEVAQKVLALRDQLLKNPEDTLLRPLPVEKRDAAPKKAGKKAAAKKEAPKRARF